MVGKETVQDPGTCSLVNSGTQKSNEAPGRPPCLARVVALAPHARGWE